MDIKVINNDADFLMLKDAWNEMIQVTSYDFDWIYKWWQHLKDNNSLNIVVATENNKIIGIAPFYIQSYRLFKFSTYKILNFLGDSLSENTDFLIANKQDRELIFKNMFDFVINNMSFDTLNLRQLSTHSPNFPLWHKYFASLRFKPEIDMVNPKIKLSAYKSYEEYYSKLSSNTKRNLNQYRNRANKNFNNIEYIFKNDITEEDIDTIAQIHIKRQVFLTSKGRDDRYCYFSDPKKLGFIKDYFCSGNSSPKVLVYLKFDDNVTSYALLLTHKKIITGWNGTIDLDYSNYSPFSLLLNELVKFAFDNHFEYFDLLGGAEDYKFRWANETFALFNIKYDKTIKKKLASLRYRF